MQTVFKILTALFLIFCMAFQQADAQRVAEVERGYDPDNTKRWSATLYGGVTLAYEDGLGMIAGGFNTSSGTRLLLGGSASYAVTRRWTLESTFHFGRFQSVPGKNRPFVNDYYLISLRNIVNLNHVFSTFILNEYINPYVILGLGVMKSNLDTFEEGFTYNEWDTSLITGLGFAFYLNKRFDLLLQYEYQIVTDDRIDGSTDRRPNQNRGNSDQFAGVTAGLRINFGPRDRRLSSWENPPPFLTDTDYRFLFAQASQVALLEERLRNLQEEVAEPFDADCLDCNVIDTRINDAEARVNTQLNAVIAGINDDIEDAYTGWFIFDLDSDVLRPEAIAPLNRVVRYMERNPDVHALITGHTCILATREYNMDLSRRRAENSKQYLVDRGIDPSRIQIEYVADVEPAFSNDEESTRRLNRRVELTYFRP